MIKKFKLFWSNDVSSLLSRAESLFQKPNKIKEYPVLPSSSIHKIDLDSSSSRKIKVLVNTFTTKTQIKRTIARLAKACDAKIIKCNTKSQVIQKNRSVFFIKKNNSNSAFGSFIKKTNYKKQAILTFKSTECKDKFVNNINKKEFDIMSSFSIIWKNFDERNRDKVVDDETKN